MRRIPLALPFALVTVLNQGCYAITPGVRDVPGEVRWHLGRPRGDDSALDLDFTPEPGRIHGKLRWGAKCHREELQAMTREHFEVHTPKRLESVAGVLVGVGVTAASVFLLSKLDSFSSEETCSRKSDGSEDCSSPRTGAMTIGLVGTLLGLLGTGAAAVTAVAPEREQSVSTEDLTPRVLATDSAKVACGEGPAVGVKVELRQGERIVDQATSDSRGEVWLSYPPKATGQFLLVLGRVPDELAHLLKSGESLGSLAVPASEAPAGTDVPSSPSASVPERVPDAP